MTNPTQTDIDTITIDADPNAQPARLQSSDFTAIDQALSDVATSAERLQAQAVAGDIWQAAFAILDVLPDIDAETAGRIAQAAADAAESAWIAEQNPPAILDQLDTQTADALRQFVAQLDADRPSYISYSAHFRRVSAELGDTHQPAFDLLHDIMQETERNASEVGGELWIAVTLGGQPIGHPATRRKLRDIFTDIARDIIAGKLCFNLANLDA